MAKFPLTRRPLNIRASAPRTGPTINRGKGNNNAATPWKFIHPVEAKFGKLHWDLAALTSNSKAPLSIGPKCSGEECNGGCDSLIQPWHDLVGAYPNEQPLCWLNPPYFNITVWAKKCAEEVQLGTRVLLLVPASVGANWYWDWVVPYADVYSVGRMVFDDCYDKQGKLITTPYPKDLILCHYDWSREAEKAGRRTGESYGDAHLGGRAEIIRWRWQQETI